MPLFKKKKVAFSVEENYYFICLGSAGHLGKDAAIRFKWIEYIRRTLIFSSLFKFFSENEKENFQMDWAFYSRKTITIITITT